MSILIKNIKGLAGIRHQGETNVQGSQMSNLNQLENAYLLIEEDMISDFGLMNNLPESVLSTTTIDASGKYVLPCWCDSHTHIVYAASREQEFVDRTRGLTYEEIGKRGGGIFNSAKNVRQATEDELYQSAYSRLIEIMQQGTGAVEIKSGYGLTVEDELKMLRVIGWLKKTHPLTIKSTLLIHAIPPEYQNQRDKYLDLIIHEIIPETGRLKLADYCDVFCERNYFTKEETVSLLNEAKKYGMIPKVHAEQLSHSGGIEAGVKTGAVSVDHLEWANDEDISLLKNSETMPTILPGAQFFLKLKNPPARKMIDAGLPLALASDYNPGSSPSGNMNLMISLACVNYNMLPEEAINAATQNGACAMGLSHSHGSITKGKKANLIITKPISSIAYLPYAFGSNLIETVIINGKTY